MNVSLAFPLDDLVSAVRDVVREELAREQGPQGFLDTKGAAAFLATSEDAVRAMVKRGDIPVHRTPNGRLLFDRHELSTWARSATPRLDVAIRRS